MFYTRKGDKGLTNLFGCAKKFSKSSPVIEALGALDELNSLLGFCKMKTIKHPVSNSLKEVQNNLFIIQGEIAGCGKSINKKSVLEIEKEIDKIGKKLPKIKSFTISGGTELSALLDYSRAVARRAERRCVAITCLSRRQKKNINPESLKYLNRLSSLLFVLARYANHDIKEKHPKY